jgi:hypothetical protein
MTDLTQHVPAATQVLASRLLLTSGVAARFCNLFISNVPGPQVPLYMNGARAVHSLGLAPLADGMGLFIATPSYNGEIGFNVISTREILPDMDVFMRCIEDALAEYRDLPAPGRKARKAPARKRTAKAKANARAKTKTPAKKKAGVKKTSPARKAAARKRRPASGKAAPRRKAGGASS